MAVKPSWGTYPVPPAIKNSAMVLVWCCMFSPLNMKENVSLGKLQLRQETLFFLASNRTVWWFKMAAEYTCVQITRGKVGTGCWAQYMTLFDAIWMRSLPVHDVSQKALVPKRNLNFLSEITACVMRFRWQARNILALHLKWSFRRRFLIFLSIFNLRPREAKNSPVRDTTPPRKIFARKM